MEALLASGQRREELVAYFGLEEYLELERLAREAQRATLAPDLRVFIVPGVMGSQLGMRRRGSLPDDVLWIDPLDIQNGKLDALRVTARNRITALGAVLFTYLRLKLRLRAAGFDALLHDYDWRLPIETLGRALARGCEPIRRRASRSWRTAWEVSSAVPRSQGAAGTPVRAVRDARDTELRFVRARAGAARHVRGGAQDRPARPRQQCREARRRRIQHLPQPVSDAAGRPSVCGGRISSIAARGPATGPRPRARLLTAAKRLARRLASADERYHVVVGVNQETVTGLTRRRDDFVYTVTRSGDGTVPAACAVLPGASHYYASVAHSELTRDETVTAAVVELLSHGRTSRIATRAPKARPGSARISDSELRRRHVGKIDWTGLEPEQRRAYLATLNEPLSLHLHAPQIVGTGHGRASCRDATGAAGRGHRTATRWRIDVRLDAAASPRRATCAYVAGIFENVGPRARLAAIDSHLGRPDHEFRHAAHVPREVGEIFCRAGGGSDARCRFHLLLVGLGHFDRCRAAAARTRRGEHRAMLASTNVETTRRC